MKHNESTWWIYVVVDKRRPFVICRYHSEPRDHPGIYNVLERTHTWLGTHFLISFPCKWHHHIRGVSPIVIKPWGKLSLKASCVHDTNSSDQDEPSYRASWYALCDVLAILKFGSCFFYGLLCYHLEKVFLRWLLLSVVVFPSRLTGWRANTHLHPARKEIYHNFSTSDKLSETESDHRKLSAKTVIYQK